MLDWYEEPYNVESESNPKEDEFVEEFFEEVKNEKFKNNDRCNNKTCKFKRTGNNNKI